MPEEMVNNKQVEETEEKTYSQEEFEAALKAETDRRVTQALKKQAEKAKEAEKVLAMNAEEKYQYQLQQKERELEEGWKQLSLERNTSAAQRVLADKGLDLALVDLVVADDADTMNDRISLLDKAFKKSVKAEVEKRLASKAPQTTVDTERTYTDKDFSQMTLQQMQEIFAAQPELFKK